MVLDNPLQIQHDKNQELIMIPALDDFETLSAEDLSGKEDVLILKNKLIMREGEHNGVHYSWEELKKCIDSGEGSSLYYDHEDSASTWIGDVKNLRADDEQKAIFADIYVVDSVAAKKLRYGAKWGISPSIDAEKLVRDGKKYALDPKIISNSLVLRPAVRETMLNEEDRVIRRSKEKSMEEDLKREREINELAEKKAQKLFKEEKQKKEEDIKKLSDDEVVKNLQEKVDKYEAESLARKSQEVLDLGTGFGILVDGDLDGLKELNDEGRAFVSKVIGRVSDTLKLGEDKTKENYEAFKSEFMKKNLKATEDDVKVAFEKLQEDLKHGKKNPAGQKSPLGEVQDRLREDLSEQKAHTNKVNTDMLAHMVAQQSR